MSDRRLSEYDNVDFNVESYPGPDPSYVAPTELALGTRRVAPGVYASIEVDGSLQAVVVESMARQTGLDLDTVQCLLAALNWDAVAVVAAVAESRRAAAHLPSPTIAVRVYFEEVVYTLNLLRTMTVADIKNAITKVRRRVSRFALCWCCPARYAE